ncbi:DUF4124 domain-containing protein [Desulfosarcina sp.]|uniref:DUF4124 domain-containing protein n=1 Tax=Desulfosarcina sp. TaxID=2027861 RepID=UPI0039710EC9
MHRMIILGLTAWFFLLGNAVVAETIYTWTDADGVRRFSNSQPPEGVAVVETIEGIQGDTGGADQNRQAYDRMVEEASQNADRHFEQQAEAKAQAAEAERARQMEAQDRRIEAERDKLQAEINAIDGRGLSTTFSAGMKENLIQQVQEKLDLLENNPDIYFSGRPSPEEDQPGIGPADSDKEDSDY